ncbi:MAG: hypothetical protein A3F54_01025 [Candidatus Kerfeldbacteria bacterium RIFCSPHIGHO2_12_FULL_48_17]|uniref:Lipoprotein n=1 Tax=Candidatus Kerfeldbacteria bacterium RIFCSPHIGHO2_12_FULL_48_17 TaxID=1798542 RepID=A0A1G2AXG2_9BACT|nr:MAG: hypothetical protein A3F54_01025 [Candidatus Kerfeldbacteria bacterium RIFCSPHIGHO2_12_FULL_48_17]
MKIHKQLTIFFFAMALFIAGCGKPADTGTVNQNANTAADTNTNAVNANQATQTTREKDGCVITGCSGQLCGQAAIISTCEYLPAYACYETAVCEKQTNGKCGWTETTQLVSCLENNRKNTENQKPTAY